jgi:hypothetical protein
MRQFLVCAGKFIGEIIDIFYPPFTAISAASFFRYGVSGAANVGFDWLLYFIVYNYILQKQFVPLGFVTIIPTSRVVRHLPHHPLHRVPASEICHLHRFRPAGQGAADPIHCGCRVNLLINYFGLKLLVELLHFYATPSKMVVTVICTIFSYFSQKTFTFKVKKSI